MAENKNQLATKNEVAKSTEQYKTLLAKQTNVYTNMLVTTMDELNIEYTDYQKICVANAISKLSQVLRDKKLTIKDLNQDEITSYLMKVAMLQVNATAIPNEMYVAIRNVYDVETKTSRPSIDFGLEGNGNDAILRRFGVGVKKVDNPLIIREGDEFTYPYFDGTKMQPITWKPKSFTNKVIAVCYIVEKTDGSVEYLISEREGVAKNLKAHISNNLLTKRDIRQTIIDKIADYSLEQLFADKDIQEYISPAWKSGSSKEDMILRKMMNNATKKYPKNFENAFITEAYESTYEDYDQYKKVNTGEQFDFTTPEEVVEEIENNSSTQQVKSVMPTGEVVFKENTPQASEEDELGF